MTTEPDELYTLRAQYWLGHYNLAIEEAKSVVRRPMSTGLKMEREEFQLRAMLASGEIDKVIAQSTGAGNDRPGLQALCLAAQYNSSNATEDSKSSIIDQLKVLVSNTTSNHAKLIAAQILLSAGLTKDALQCVSTSSTTMSLEQMLLALQIYIKIDRIDLAQSQLKTMKLSDEDAVLTQLGTVYVALANGSSSANDVLHAMNSLMEQYGPSPLLLNLTACGHLQSGEYNNAEKRLEECLSEFGGENNNDTMIADTYINMIVACTHQGKSIDQYVTQMKQFYPNHTFCTGLDRVLGAIDREAVKYQV